MYIFLDHLGNNTFTTLNPFVIQFNTIEKVLLYSNSRLDKPNYGVTNFGMTPVLFMIKVYEESRY